MKEIKNIIQLNEAIQVCEIQRKEEELELKEELTLLFEKMQPINIINDTVSELVASKSLQTDVIDLSVGTAVGFAVRKIIVGKTVNPIAQILGRMIEQTVSQKIISNRVGIHAFGRNILNLLTSSNKKAN